MTHALVTARLRWWQTLIVAAAVLFLPGFASAQAQTSGWKNAQISIDADRFPQLAVTADNARLVDILRQLGERLGFSIDNLPDNDPQTTTISFHGELSELLDVLGHMSFVMLGNRGKPERLIIVSYDRAISDGAKNPAGRVASADDPKPIQAAPQRSLPSPDRVLADAPRQTAAPPGRLNRLLHTQAVQGAHQADRDNADGAVANAPANAPGSSDGAPAPNPSLASMMQAAHADAQTLVAALRAACIGPNCPH